MTLNSQDEVSGPESGARQPNSTSSRRSFLLRTGSSLFGAGFAGGLFGLPQLSGQMLQSAQGNGRTLVLINLLGGYDALSMLRPTLASGAVSGSSAFEFERQRPVLARPPIGQTTRPVAGIADLRWHPALRVFEREYANGDLAVVRKVGLPTADRSHFKARNVMSLGRRDLAPRSDRRGWLGRLADAGLNDRYDIVGLGVARPNDFRSNGREPLSLERLENFRSRITGRDQDHRFRREIWRRILAQNNGGGPQGEADLKERFPRTLDTAKDIDERLLGPGNMVAGNYGAVPPGEPLAASLEDIAHAMNASLATRIFYTRSTGFDTHGGQEIARVGNRRPTLGERLTGVDAALDAFITDLKSVPGRWDNTLVLLYTEFGRRNDENVTQGTDHGHGFDVYALGGGVAGGLLGNPITGADIAAPVLPAEIDFRSVFQQGLEWLQLSGGIHPSVFGGFTPLATQPGFRIF